LEVWCGAFGPETFFEQTAQTFSASLRGRNIGLSERDLILAYHTGAFSSSAKVKPLSYYLNQLRGPEPKISNAGLIAKFKAMQASGLPIKITRVPREG
jgi:hypothetical protein